MGETIFVGGGGEGYGLPQNLLLKYGNRHGLIAGATGTGKTVTLQILAEGFSAEGVPVFMADVKGDLSGISNPGQPNPKIITRLETIKLTDFGYERFPVEFWDIYGQNGLPVRTTISEMGPIILARILNLNDTQSSVLNLVFKIADDSGLMLLDLKDLKSMIQFAGENARQFAAQYGNISVASVGAIQRALVDLESNGGDLFFGEPALNLDDFMQTGEGGKGVINILSADKLIHQPKLYSMFLLWLLSELFERLPESGDPDKPKLVFFFDEAHLLFDDVPAVLKDKIEQVVRLIRSKGIGVYFVSQYPLDIPDVILGQLGNRIQHALRAFTPKDQKMVKAAAQTFRQSSEIDTESAITQLGLGEALVSFLDQQGVPQTVARALIRPPHSQIGPITPEERQAILNRSPMHSFYSRTFDRESAFEILKKRADQQARQAETAPPVPERKPQRQQQTVLDAFVKSTARTMGSQIGRQLIRGILGSIFGGRR